MKLKFNTKMVLLNVIITFVITALVGFIVVQGLLTSAINTALGNLGAISDEANVMISLSLNTIQSDKPASLLLKENANYYAAQMGANYSLAAAVFDSSLNIIGSYQEAAEYSSYAEDAKKVLQKKEKAYIYTVIGGQNCIVFFSPLIVNDMPFGVLMFIYPTARAEESVHTAVRLFVIASVVAAIASASLHTVSQRTFTKPLKQLADFFKKKSLDPEAEMPLINTKDNETMQLLANAYGEMQASIDEKIEELDCERANFENIVASLQDGIITFSAEGELQSANNRAEELFKCITDYNELVPGYKMVITEALKNNDKPETEASYNGRDLMVTALPVQRRNEPNSVMFAIRDITAAKQAENEQNRFISSVSHELRTPLTVIIGYVDMLKRRGTQDKALTERALNALEAEAQRLLGLVNDLLSMGKMNSYEFDLSMETVDLDEILQYAALQMSVMGQPRGIAVLYESTPLPRINGDADRLKQCFINIIDNAVKYSNDGDVVRLTAIAHDRYIEVTVRDYGAGIPEEKKEKVFDAFYRVEDDRTRLTSAGGYGLGLSVVKNIISRHNGSVSIESEKEHGTLVTVRLPIGNEEVLNEKN